MAIVSDIFDEMKTLIDSCLGDYKELENPFIPEDNGSNLWNKAFGVAFGPGSNLELLMGCKKISCQRGFDVSLINKVNATQTNVDKRDDQQKDIVEDMMKIKVCFEECPTLGSLCTKCVFTADGGVEFVDSGRGKFLLMTAIVECTFFENI